MSSLRIDRRITQRVIRIDICFGSVNWEGPERVLNLPLPSRVWNAGKGVLCSEEGSGKCESSGVKSYGFNLSRDTRYCLLFHTLDEVGNHFIFLIFWGLETCRFGSEFRHSHKAKLALQTLTGRKPKSFRETRWVSKWKLFKQLLEQFGDV